MSPLTVWHYFLLAVLALLLLIGILVSLRTDSKYSVFTTIFLIIVLIGAFTWKTINEKVYVVEVSELDQERYYQSEQIVLKGSVRNVGNFPVANVVATVKLINSHGGVQGKQSIFTQPSVFAQIYEGDNPNFKRQTVAKEEMIADYLNPGKSKPFTIIMDYPSYFQHARFEVTAKAN